MKPAGLPNRGAGSFGERRVCAFQERPGGEETEGDELDELDSYGPGPVDTEPGPSLSRTGLEQS